MNSESVCSHLTRLVLVLLLLALTLLAACATTSGERTAPTRAELDAMADQEMARLLAEQPQLVPLIETLPGWVALEMHVAKIPAIGTGSGYGVVVDQRQDRRSYSRVSRFEIGGGLGAQKYYVVILFEDEKLLERAAKGTWHYEAGAEVAGGTSNAHGTGVKTGPGYQAYRLSDSGAVAAITVRIARAKPYEPD